MLIEDKNVTRKHLYEVPYGTVVECNGYAFMKINNKSFNVVKLCDGETYAIDEQNYINELNAKLVIER